LQNFIELEERGERGGGLIIILKIKMKNNYIKQRYKLIE